MANVRAEILRAAFGDVQKLCFMDESCGISQPQDQMTQGITEMFIVCLLIFVKKWPDFPWLLSLCEYLVPGQFYVILFWFFLHCVSDSCIVAGLMLLLLLLFLRLPKNCIEADLPMRRTKHITSSPQKYMVG